MRTSVENYSPATSYDDALRRAARVWGIQDEYWDIWGNRHVAEPDVQRSILRSMGMNPDSLESLNEAIRRRADLDWRTLAPATLVLPLSAGIVPINVPDGLQSAELQAEFHLGERRIRAGRRPIKRPCHRRQDHRRWAAFYQAFPAAAGRGATRISPAETECGRDAHRNASDPLSR